MIFACEANAKIILIFKHVYCTKNLFIKLAKLASWTSSAGKVLISQVVTHAVFNRPRVKEFIELPQQQKYRIHMRYVVAIILSENYSKMVAFGV